MMRNLKIALAALIMVTLFQACSKDPIVGENAGDAPVLPPMETFLMPFQGFENPDTTDKAAGASNSRTVNNYANWFYAATNVVVWNSVVTLNLVIPVASYAEAFNHKAEFQGNGIWLWAYDFVAEGVTYQAELTGQFISDNQVQWDMYITQVGGFSKVHWYTGVTATDRTGGSWTLNYQPENPTPYLGIEYSRDFTSGTASIRYTNIIPNHNDNGNYIEYWENYNMTSGMNRTYEVYDASDERRLMIEWSKEQRYGRVMDPVHFGDTDWHCWDETFRNMDC